MECPQCRKRMAVQDRICRACRFYPEEGRLVEIVPPRAAKAPEFCVMPRRHLLRLRRQPEGLVIPAHPAFAVAGVIPGLAHLLLGRRRQALVWAVIVGGLIWQGFLRGGAVGQMLVGLAAGFHVHSIMEVLLAGKERRSVERVSVSAVLLIVAVALYLPLIRIVDPGAQTTLYLSRSEIVPVLTIAVVTVAVFWAAIYVLLGHASAVLGSVLSRLLSLRRRQR